MKVLVVSPYYYPKVGGLESYVHHAVMNLKKYGHTVVVVTSNHLKNTDSTETLEGYKVYRLKTWLRISNTPLNPFWFIRLNQLVSSEKPDVVFAHTPVPFMADVAAVVAKHSKTPFVLTYHAGSLKKGKLLPDLITSCYQWTFERIMLHLSDEIVVLNEYVKKTTLPRYSSKVNVINPGTTLPISKRIHKKINQHNKIIFVGNLDRANAFKGLETLLRAFAQALNEKSTISLEVVGGGDHLAHYHTVCEELGITDKVIFVGAVDPQQIASHYENADLLVLPSLTNAESLGLVLLEAMSFGLPVVASNVGGIPYVVEDGKNGRLVPPGNIRALSESILYTLNDLNYSKFSANNLQTCKRFNWVNHTESLTRIFQKAVDEKGGR